MKNIEKKDANARNPHRQAALQCLARKKKLERQLEDQSKTFLSCQKGLIIDRPKQIVYLSSIFKWYGKDFVGKFTPESGFNGFNKKEQAVLNFCSGYLPEDNRTYLTKKQYSVKYLDYDWPLNDKRGNQ